MESVQSDLPPLCIGIDLGRHRSFCALADDDGQRLVPLSDKHDGLVLRWLTRSGSERVTERLFRLSGGQQFEAVATAAAMAEAIFPELAEGETLAASPWIAIPTAFGPACRAAVVEGMHSVGVPVTQRNLIDRPIASLAAWRAGAPDASGMVLVIDNDGGQLSAAAADLDQSRLLFSVPLSNGPEDDEADVEQRLRLVVDEAHRLIRAGDSGHGDELLGEGPIAVPHVVVTGSSSQHPQFLALVERVLPDSAMVGVRAEQAHTVVFGLLNLDVLAGFSACWPTGNVLVDGIMVRPPGPVAGNDIPLLLQPDSIMTFTGPANEELVVEVGSVRSTGVRLPTELGLYPRMRVLSDGRILVLGEEETRPLSVRVQWPVPAATSNALPLEVVGRRPVQLTDPKVALRRRATVGS